MESIDAEIVKMFVQGNCPPQLLDRAYSLREKSIELAMEPCMASNPASTFEVFDFIVSKYGADNIAKEIKGRKVIELGPSHDPKAKFFLDNGAKEYVGVDLFHSFTASCFVQNYIGAKIVKRDALSYLMKQENESAVVASFGFLCDALHMLNPHYIPFVVREIYRVTPKGGISIHSTACDFENSFEAAGFKSEKASFAGNKGKPGAIFMGVLRK